MPRTPTKETKPYETPEFIEAYKMMMYDQGKRFGGRRFAGTTKEDRRIFSYSGVYTNIKRLKGTQAAVSRIVTAFGTEKARELIEKWDKGALYLIP